MKEYAPDALSDLAARIGLTDEEPKAWRTAADAMYIPFNEQLGIHEQDDSFLSLDPVDMEMVPRNTDIREIMHPLNLWRMQVLKQADVVLLMLTQGHQYSLETKKANYEFYEPRTCHGSSLSACIHAIIACEIGKPRDAYDFFRESATMDLSDFKDNTGGGVHSACLGGTWMAVAMGFAGLRDYPEGLSLNPELPDPWEGYSLKLLYRGSRIGVSVDANCVVYRHLEGGPVTFKAGNESVSLSPGQEHTTARGD
jgi:alpha,alpha-trehalose phosphorylase